MQILEHKMQIINSKQLKLVFDLYLTVEVV